MSTTTAPANSRSKKYEDLKQGFLHIHSDLIIKEGPLKQKTGPFGLSWKSSHFVFDGHCLYRAKQPTGQQIAAIREANSNLASTLSSSPSNSNSNDPIWLKQGYDYLNEQRKLYKVDYAYDKYVFVQSNQHPSQSNSSSPRVFKVMDGETFTNRKYSIGLFFDKESGLNPLFLCADSDKSQAQWLEALQKALEKASMEASSSVVNTSSGSLNQSSHRASTQSVNNIHVAIEAMVDPALISNAFGDIQCVNHALSRLFGYTPTQMLNKNVRDLMPEKIGKVHHLYMDKYRKTGLKSLIGVPRALPIRLSNGTEVQVVLSLGEIPNSTNADKDRFLAVMKMKDATIDIESADTSTDSDVSQLDYQRITSIDTSDCLELLNEKVEMMFSNLERRSGPIDVRIKLLEEQNARLIAVTSEQARVLQHLETDCYEHNSVSVKRSYTDLLSSVQSMKNLLSESDRSLYQIATSKDMPDLDVIMHLPLPLKHFLLYAAMEQSTDNLKFYMYIKKQYVKEKSLEMLALKKDYVMNTFILIGSQHELNISSNERVLIEQNYSQARDYQSDKTKVKRRETAGGTEEEDEETLIRKEQHFFDSLLCEIKGVLLDTFMRFRSHAMFTTMKTEVLETLHALLKLRSPA